MKMRFFCLILNKTLKYEENITHNITYHITAITYNVEICIFPNKKQKSEENATNIFLMQTQKSEENEIFYLFRIKIREISRK